MNATTIVNLESCGIGSGLVGTPNVCPDRIKRAVSTARLNVRGTHISARSGQMWTRLSGPPTKASRV